MSTKNRLSVGASWMLFAYGATFATQAIYFLILARALGASEYGVFAGALAVITIATTFTGLGGGNLLVMRTSRELSQYRSSLGTALMYIISSAIPIGLLVVAIGAAAMPRALSVVAVLAVSELVFTSLLDLGYQVAQSHEELKRTAYSMVASAVARLLAVATFSRVVQDPSAVSWAIIYTLVNAFMGTLVLFLAIRRFGSPKVDRRDVLTAWRHSIWFCLGSGSRAVYVDADKFFLSRYAFGSTITGSYAMASRIASFATVPAQAIIYSMNTRLFRSGSLGYGETWRVMRRPLVFVTVYGVVAAFVLAGAAPLLPAVLGPSFADSSRVLLILCPLPLIQGGNYVLGDALMGIGAQHFRASLQVACALIAILLCVFLIPPLGWLGAALASLLSASILLSTLSMGFMLGLRREFTGRSELMAASTTPTVGGEG